MVMCLDIELRLRKLSGRLTVARILLLLGWIAVVASLPMGMGAVGGFHPKTYTTWATITSPFFLLFTPIFLGLAAGTAAGFIAPRVKRSRPIWLCRVATIGILCESLPLYAADVVSLVIYLRQPVPRTPITDGLGGLFFDLGSLLVGLPPWIIPIRRRKLSQTADSSAPNNGGASS